LPDDSERLKYYKELMSADEQESRQILQKLADFAGPVPAELTNLNRILQLSRRAGLLKIYHLEYSSSGFDLFFTADFQMPADFPAKVLEKYGPRVQFIKSRNGDGIHVSEEKTHTPVEEAEEIITFLEYVLKTQNAIV